MSGVTDTRYFSREMSRSRNDPYGPTPDACHHCRTAFTHGQTRYPILSGINWSGGWGLASVCMDCFKCAAVEEATKLQRHQHKCEGCFEPMLTVLNACAGQWRVCSPRCYQRVYRKRRHGRDSVVAWKGHRAKTVPFAKSRSRSGAGNISARTLSIALRSAGSGHIVDASATIDDRARRPRHYKGG